MLQIRIKNLSSLTTKQSDKIKLSCEEGVPVVNWHVWQAAIANAKYLDARGLKGPQILDLILKSEVIELDVIGFYKSSNTIGYTYLGQNKQWINRKYLDKESFSRANTFAHIMHETMHWKFSFKHPNYFRRSSSVPYRVGNITASKYVDYYANKKKGLFVPASFIPIENKIEFEFIS